MKTKHRPEPTHQPPVWAAADPSTFEYADFRSTYWDFYPRGESVVFDTIYPLEDGVGLDIALRSETPDFSHFLVSINDGPRETVDNGRFQIEFEDNHTLENYTNESRKAKVWVVGAEGSESGPYRIHTMFAPSERYIANGHVENGHGRIQIQLSDIKYARTSLEDWVLHKPTGEDREFARKEWGHLIREERSDIENAHELAKNLLETLDPHRGTPSDAMASAGPFGQYERLVAGIDHCWCANLADIYSHACNSLGIPARFIIMRHQLFPPPENVEDGYEIMMAGGHTIVEVFTADNGQWNWVDLSARALGAYLGPIGPLSLMELHRCVNEPSRFPHLEVEMYDSEAREARRMKVSESPILPNLRNSLKQDQLFRYMRRPE